jgi:hypothetical protein
MPSSGVIMVLIIPLIELTKILTVQQDKQQDQQGGFTYVQGMNVLAAPFLYTMPSEVEAFFCFAKFIEESCPSYVQPNLDGVHWGLKASSRLFSENRSLDI